MSEVLQRFSVYNLSNVLGVVLICWLIWPVLCGILGAKRGQAFQGVMHGLLWGPFGLPVVLLSGRKHVCPTCGKRTLSRPVDTERKNWDVPPPVAADASGAVPPLACARPVLVGVAPEPAGTDGDSEEQARLRAWLDEG